MKKQKPVENKGGNGGKKSAGPLKAPGKKRTIKTKKGDYI